MFFLNFCESRIIGRYSRDLRQYRTLLSLSLHVSPVTIAFSRIFYSTNGICKFLISSFDYYGLPQSNTRFNPAQHGTPFFRSSAFRVGALFMSIVSRDSRVGSRVGTRELANEERQASLAARRGTALSMRQPLMFRGTGSRCLNNYCSTRYESMITLASVCCNNSPFIDSAAISTGNYLLSRREALSMLLRYYRIRVV